MARFEGAALSAASDLWEIWWPGPAKPPPFSDIGSESYGSRRTEPERLSHLHNQGASRSLREPKQGVNSVGSCVLGSGMPVNAEVL